MVIPMFERIDRSETFTAEDTVKEWLSDVWFSPLVKSDTILHRLKARERFNQVFEHIGKRRFDTLMDSSKFAAGRFMGEVLFPSSDHDIFLFASDEQTSYEFYESYLVGRSNEENSTHRFFREQLCIDVVGVESINSSTDAFNLIKTGIGVFLLATPDELILGEQKVAQEGRLTMIRQLDAMSESDRQDYWDNSDSILNQCFRTFYVEWPFNQDKHGQTEEPANMDKRGIFFQRILDVALETSDPETYITSFFQSRKNLTLPDYRHYREVVKNNNGKLSILV